MKAKTEVKKKLSLKEIRQRRREYSKKYYARKKLINMSKKITSVPLDIDRPILPKNFGRIKDFGNPFGPIIDTSATYKVNTELHIGWICPKCEIVHAPAIKSCESCKP